MKKLEKLKISTPTKILKAKPEVAIHWFRKGLRLHDNPSLREVLETKGCQIIPLFILDPHFQNPNYVGVNRMNFLMQCLADLDSNLKQWGLRLVVAKGKPEDVFPKLFSKYDTKLLSFEKETVEPYGKARDQLVHEICMSEGVPVKTFATHTLFD